MKNPIIGIDLSGGDHDPEGRLQAVKKFSKEQKNIDIRLYIDDQYLSNKQHLFAGLAKQITIISTDQAIFMDDSPLKALKKRKSCMSLAIKDVAEGRADVVLTAGNTAAMVAFAKHWLKPLCDIDRPALATLLPGTGKRTLLLDVGATLDYRADDLFNLARMGSAATQSLGLGVGQPEVALLNIGVENTKGNDAVQQANRLLESSELNYLGYIEGSSLFDGYADVVCCDGFVGNIALKACEGIAKLIKISSGKSRMGKLLGKFNAFNFNPSQYNGAMLLGLDGLIIKSHGNCDEFAFKQAIHQAVSSARTDIILNMKNTLGG